ncbi:MAG TPA: glycosyltransferase [Algoriphagus sp.]|nr:glycosyltransferase [Algoriphagus sp.]
MKRVLHIQFSMKSAGTAAWRLHEAFSEQEGFSSEVLSLHQDDSERPGLYNLPKLARYTANLNNRLHKYVIKYDQRKYALFSYPILGTDISNHECVKRADVIYVHWVQMGFMTLGGFEKLIKTGKKIIFFMHDMWYVTGGCHNSFGCNGYQVDCSNCPILETNKNIPSKQLALKKEIFNHENVSFVSPSRWLMDCAKKSISTKDRAIYYIPNYFKSKHFVPQDKAQAKLKLGINPEIKIIAFGAVTLFSAFKGFEYLEKALRHLPTIFDSKDIQILIFGSGTEDEMNNRFPYKFKFLGYLNSEEQLALAYGASDVFVIPSVADNQPTMVVESLACGIPVVGFETGGIPDMIQHKSNGYLAKSKDYIDLAEGIKYCLQENLSGYQLEYFDPKNIMDLHTELINEHDAIGV